MIEFSKTEKKFSIFVYFGIKFYLVVYIILLAFYEYLLRGNSVFWF